MFRKNCEEEYGKEGRGRSQRRRRDEVKKLLTKKRLREREDAL